MVKFVDDIVPVVGRMRNIHAMQQWLLFSLKFFPGVLGHVLSSMQDPELQICNVKFCMMSCIMLVTLMHLETYCADP